jgi:hypothetical protein
MFGNENEPKILSESDIMELKKKHGIILFYMNGCGHCDVMKPAWNKIINELKDKHKNEIILGAIESSSMHIFNKHGIKPSVSGFPTILYFHPSKHDSPETYKGDRSYEDLKKWILTKKSVTTKNKPIVLLTEYSGHNPNNTTNKSGKKRNTVMLGGGRKRRRTKKTRKYRSMSKLKRKQSRRHGRH